MLFDDFIFICTIFEKFMNQKAEGNANFVNRNFSYIAVDVERSISTLHT